MEPGQPHSVRHNDYDNVNTPTNQAVSTGRKGSRWLIPTTESKLFVGLLVTAAVVVLIALFGSGIGSLSATSPVKSDQYQAVFLSNGQVYFGKITGIKSGYMVLKDIYYLQVDQQIQPERGETSEQPQVQLVQLGNELHGPESEMFISTEQVVFWENLKAGDQAGQVVEAIKRFQDGGGNARPNSNTNNLNTETNPAEGASTDSSATEDTASEGTNNDAPSANEDQTP